MSRLPVIAGFGGISPAGRSSAHHGFRRLVIDALPAPVADATWRSLGTLMHVPDSGSDAARAHMRANTLVRRIDAGHFDSDSIPWHRRMTWSPADGGTRVRIGAAQLPDPLPPGWRLLATEGRTAEVLIEGSTEVLVPAVRRSEVNAAGQLPGGFDPRALYPACLLYTSPSPRD